MDYSIKVDYLSAMLNQDFSATDLEIWSSAQYPDENGEIRPSLRSDQYGVDFRGGNAICRTYNEGQFNFWGKVTDHDLRVTRVDLALDVYGEDYMYASEMAERTRQSYRNRKITHTEGYWSSPSGTGGEKSHTWTFGSRGSEFQIRIYTKGGFVRIEFQIRSQLARDVAGAVSASHNAECKDDHTVVECSRALKGVFKGLESRKLYDDIYLPPDVRLPLPPREVPNKSNRQLWVETQVLKACLKEYRESGINLPLNLLQLFNEKVGITDVGNITRFPSS
jgi:hypothetical protein